MTRPARRGTAVDLPTLPSTVQAGLTASAVALILSASHDVWRRWGWIPVGCVVVWGALLFLIRRRHNWARFAYAAILIVVVPRAIVTVLPYLHNDPVHATSLLFANILEIFGVVWLFRRSSSDWFRYAEPDHAYRSAADKMDA